MRLPVARTLAGGNGMVDGFRNGLLLTIATLLAPRATNLQVVALARRTDVWVKRTYASGAATAMCDVFDGSASASRRCGGR
ncbi:MAG TPA: hypothetical protein VF128_11900 [Gemmatimonadaceae bacterium]